MTRSRNLKRTFRNTALFMTAMAGVQVVLAALEPVPNWSVAELSLVSAACMWFAFLVQQPSPENR